MLTADLPTGTITFLFTDIESSTQIWERHPQAMRAALARHDALLEEAVSAHGGRVIKHTGDGAYAVFARAADALTAAVEFQAALLAAPWADLAPDRLVARAGVHSGEAELREGDYHGMALNRAARIMSSGHGGQILLSAVTASICEGRLPPGGSLRSRCEHRLRGLTRPEQIYQLLFLGLPADFPPLRSQGEYIVSLPVPATGFVGRGPELRQIVDLLNDSSIRLLSLVGPGGTGKTRLAIEAAGEVARAGGQRFHDGVIYVPLAPLVTAEAIATAVAQAVGFRFRQSDEPPRRQLFDFLRRKQVLLVLDNIEHLLSDGAAELAAELLAAAPGIGLLVTSRIRLNVPGEHLYPVRGMRQPAARTVRDWQEMSPGEIESAAAAYSAIRLFAQSATRVRPGFRLGPDNIADVSRICRQVEGMPLGIELAAAWLEALTLPEIADEIARSLDILATEQHGVPDRQRSIRAVFDTSWQLLTDRERAVLPMLSVFRAGFAREAAEFVAAASLRDLLGLVNKSWLQMSSDDLRVTSDESRVASGELQGANSPATRQPTLVTSSSRFQIHELLRQYAEEKLREWPELETQARDRASRYYARFLESQLRRMTGPDQTRAFDAVAEEFDDIREAWNWWVHQGAFDRLTDQMLLPLFIYATSRFVGADVGPLLDEAIQKRVTGEDAGGRPPSGLGTRHSALGTSPDVPLATLLTARLGIYQYFMTGEFHTGDSRQAWAISEALGDEAPRRLGFWYGLLNLIYGYQVDYAAAVARLRAVIAAPGNNDLNAAAMRQSLGRLLTREFAPDDNLQEARRLLDEAAAVFERLGNRDACATIYFDQAELATHRRRYEEGLEFLDRAQPLAEAVGNWGALWNMLLLRREVYLQQGHPERMFPVYDTMLAMSRRAGNYRLEVWTLSWDSIYALRYHSTERALFKRQAAAVVAEEFGLAYDRAWNTWEIGEIYRVRGDWSAAQQWYASARPLFEANKDPMGLAFCRRAQGELELHHATTAANAERAAAHLAAAAAHFQAYLEWTLDARNTWSRVFALCGLGRVALAGGDHDAARERFHEALVLTRASGRRDLEGLPLGCVAHLAAAAGHPPLATRLATTVTASPFTWLETRQWVGELAAEGSRAGAGQRTSGRAGEVSDEAAGGGQDEMGMVIDALLAVEGPTTAEWLSAASGVFAPL